VAEYETRIDDSIDAFLEGLEAKVVIALPNPPRQSSSSTYSHRLRERKKEGGKADRMIGLGGFNDFITNKETGLITADLGIVIDSSEVRKGYAREVLIAMLDWAFGVSLVSSENSAVVEDILGGKTVDVVIMETLAANAPWRAMMEKMGFEGVEGVGKDGLDAVYTISKEDWLKRTAPN
jgi:RimJ/RimL family protein N-acetyltransferase